MTVIIQAIAYVVGAISNAITGAVTKGQNRQAEEARQRMLLAQSSGGTLSAAYARQTAAYVEAAQGRTGQYNAVAAHYATQAQANAAAAAAAGPVVDFTIPAMVVLAGAVVVAAGAGGSR
jgi:hypothetical protein